MPRIAEDIRLLGFHLADSPSIQVYLAFYHDIFNGFSQKGYHAPLYQLMRELQYIFVIFVNFCTMFCHLLLV